MTDNRSEKMDDVKLEWLDPTFEVLHEPEGVGAGGLEHTTDGAS